MRRPILIAVVIANFAGTGLAQVVHAPKAHTHDKIDQDKADIFNTGST